jgi:uncharacterized protein YjiS (DUF1127 family)|tara:strand:+ start:1001 stop:1213 length:213 start_codon:yes stop_codon:yes gene_type:complete
VTLYNKIKETLRKRVNMNQTINQLHNLSDTELKDIGIYRGQIEEIARGIIDFHRTVRDGNLLTSPDKDEE